MNTTIKQSQEENQEVNVAESKNNNNTTRRKQSVVISEKAVVADSFEPFEDVLPPIPGTRRLGNRRSSRMPYRRPSELNLDDDISSPLIRSFRPLDSPKVNSPLMISKRSLRPTELLMPPPMSPRFRGPIASPPNGPIASPASSRRPVDGQPAVWDADAFRIKRQEAQLALEIIPKYAAVLKSAGPRPEFETIMQESIEMHMDDEYDEALMEVVRYRALARVFLVWKTVAQSHVLTVKRQRDAKPASACAKLELLARQGPRIQTRGIGGTRIPSNLIKVPSRPRNDSSVTTDATRPSINDEIGLTEVQGIVQNVLPIIDDQEQVDHSEIVKKLYADATNAEIDASKRVSKRIDSTRRLGQMINAIGRVASFRRPKE